MYLKLLIMERLKTYKYRIYPTRTQQVLLGKHFGAVRWVYNWCLARKTEEYTKNKKTLSKYDLMKEVTILRTLPETAWLKEINAQGLQSAVGNLDSAYTKFFREKTGFPKFKSKKKSRLSAEFRQGNRINLTSGKLFIAKFKEGIRCNFHRTFDGEVRTVTVSKTPTGKYHACILVKEIVPELPSFPLDINKALGIDLGIKSLAVTSNNEIFENPKNLNRSLHKLTKAQRRLSKKKKGSNNRSKQRKKVALVCEKISNQRKDSLHKISKQLVDDSQVTTYCMETLNISGMVKNKYLAKAISDAGWSTLISFVEYKAAWAGKNVLRIGQFEPSSRTCNMCGKINTLLKLSDRIWTCECGAVHNRDFLASCNIRDFAFAKQNLIGVASPKFKPVEKSVQLDGSMKQEACC